MLAENPRTWTLTTILASLAVAFAAAGLGLTTFAPGPAPAVASALLLVSLGATAGAFWLLALRVRRLEMENVGLVEEMSQEFDRVRDKVEILGEALEAPRTLTPEDVEREARDTPMRRVPLK